MTNTKRRQFIIRAAQPQNDLEACLKLRSSVETQAVWQMQMHKDNADHTQITFQTLRLPRPIRVPYPRGSAELESELKNAAGWLVAEAEAVILGFLHVELYPADGNAWVRNLVVDEPWRRRKIGRALLEQAGRWAQLQHAKRLTLETTTRSDPAIRFMLARGLAFCGFHDRYYRNQDIAVFFGLNL
jgi:GNAT superfamily N-acetyltransferase